MRNKYLHVWVLVECVPAVKYCARVKGCASDTEMGAHVRIQMTVNIIDTKYINMVHITDHFLLDSGECRDITLNA